MKKRNAKFKPFEGIHPNGRHLRITLTMMVSEAWLSLSPHAISVYLKFKIKYNGDNERNLSLTYSEKPKKMTQRTFTKVLKELVDKGFLDIVEYRRHKREATIFGLSNRWSKYGTKDFIEEHWPI